MGHITHQYGPYYSPTPGPSPKEGNRKAFAEALSGAFPH